jgi:hypothetical protein
MSVAIHGEGECVATSKFVPQRLSFDFAQDKKPH